MNYLKSSLIPFSLILLFIIVGCNKDETNPIGNESNLTSSENGKIVNGTGTPTVQPGFTNGNMENSTTGYWKGGTTFKGFSFDYSDKESVSSTHSLSIVASNAPANNFTYWAQTFKAEEYVGKKITLTVWTKYFDVDGDGIMFVLRGDNTDTPQGYAEAFSTTQRKIELKGNSDWRKLDVSMDPVPEGIKSLTVYLLISSTNGTVFFDNLDILQTAATPPLTDISNGNFENGITSPDNWWSGNSSSGINLSWDTNESLSPNHSAKMSSNGSGDKFAVWAQTISASQLIGKKVTLNVFVKADALTGDGVYIAIRGDDTSVPSGYSEVFSTTQGKQLISGTFDWKKISVILDQIPPNIKSLTFYLIYGTNTSGLVNFDDVSLEKE